MAQLSRPGGSRLTDATPGQFPYGAYLHLSLALLKNGIEEGLPGCFYLLSWSYTGASRNSISRVGVFGGIVPESVES
jgi:hypothetical protein